jgi:hypothetical protein
MPPYFVVSNSGDRRLVLEDDVDYDGATLLVERWSARLGIQVLERID